MTQPLVPSREADDALQIEYDPEVRAMAAP